LVCGAVGRIDDRSPADKELFRFKQIEFSQNFSPDQVDAISRVNCKDGRLGIAVEANDPQT